MSIATVYIRDRGLQAYDWLEDLRLIQTNRNSSLDGALVAISIECFTLYWSLIHLVWTVDRSLSLCPAWYGDALIPALLKSSATFSHSFLQSGIEHCLKFIWWYKASSPSADTRIINWMKSIRYPSLYFRFSTLSCFTHLFFSSILGPVAQNLILMVSLPSMVTNTETLILIGCWALLPW